MAVDACKKLLFLLQLEALCCYLDCLEDGKPFSLFGYPQVDRTTSARDA